MNFVQEAHGQGVARTQQRMIRDLNEEERQALLRLLGNQVKTLCFALGIERPLFAILLNNDPAQSHWISNCESADLVKALRESADSFGTTQEVQRSGQ